MGEPLGDDDEQQRDEYDDRRHHSRAARYLDRFVSRGHGGLDDEDQEQPSLKRRRFAKTAESDDDDAPVEHRGHHRYVDRLVLRSHTSRDDVVEPQREERSPFDAMEQTYRKMKKSVHTTHVHIPKNGHRSHHERKSSESSFLGDGGAASFLGKAGLARKITSLDKDVALMASDAAALSKRTGTQH